MIRPIFDHPHALIPGCASARAVGGAVPHCTNSMSLRVCGAHALNRLGQPALLKTRHQQVAPQLDARLSRPRA